MKRRWGFNLFGSSSSTNASTSSSSFKLTKLPNDIIKLNDSVWEFYKPDSDRSPPEVEILFFHGAQLVNDPDTFWRTWLSRDGDVVWPTAWLTKKFPKARMLFISYDSSIRKSAGSSGHKDTYQTVENLMHDIIWNSKCKAGQTCPLIFAGHSFGGIIIKDFLVRCHEYANIRPPGDSYVKEIRMFLHHCKGIFYYSMPNAGSRLPDGLSWQDHIFGNVNELLVEFLTILNKHTARINSNFSDLRHNHHQAWKIRGVAELLETNLRDSKRRKVVEEASVRQDVDSIYWVDADHFDISRAKDQRCRIFTGLSDLVAEHYNLPSSIPRDSQLAHLFGHTFNQFRDSLSKLLKTSEEVTTAIQHPTGRKKPRLDFERDEQYVRLEATEKEVRTSLLRLGESNHKLVLLHGGTGRGKSTLARDLALQIQSPEQPAQSTQSSDLSSHAHSMPTSSDPVSDVDMSDSTQLHEIFEDVVFLDCGPDKQLSILQQELRQWLQGCPINSFTEGVASDDLQESIDRLLRPMKLLIVLDDVENRELLEKMVRLTDKAPNVKFLVTSQDKSLCIHLKPTDRYMSVPLENASRPDAMEILARHIFWPENGCSFIMQSIPEHPEIRKCANDIIDLVDGNLLAIACVGAARFDSIQFQKPECWKNVLERLNYWLNVHQDDTKWVLRKAPTRSYFAAIHFSFEHLKGDEKMLLALTALCREPSVHEDILEYLYNKSGKKTQRQPFQSQAKSLKGRQLLRIEGSRCSVHNLLRLFLKEHFSLEYKEAFVKGLSENVTVGTIHETEKDILSAMCMLYLEEGDYAETIARKLETEAVIRTDYHYFLIVIEEVVLLAVKETSTWSGWTEELQLCSRKVFLTLVSAGSHLDWQGTEFLLRQPPSRGHMARTLFNLLVLGDPGGPGEWLKLAEKMCLPLLEPGECLELAEKMCLPLLEIATEEKVFAAEYLEWVTTLIGFSLSISRANSDSVTRNEKIRACATKLLKKYFEELPDDFVLSAEDLGILGNLVAVFRHLNIGHENVNPQKTIKRLVFALVQSPDSKVQSSAFEALHLMASEGCQGLCKEICDTPQSLSNLVEAIGKENVPDLQLAAIVLLRAIVKHGDTNCCQSISSVTGGLQALVHAIERSQNEKLPTLAADTLALLASEGGEDLCKKICRTPLLVKTVVIAMRKQDDPRLQLTASQVLSFIATDGKKDCCQEISSVPGAIEAMVDAIAGGQNSNFQQCAALTLFSLTFHGGKEVCNQICKTRESLSNLVAAMNGNVLLLQLAAVKVLSNLVYFGGKQCYQELSNFGGMIEALVGVIAGNQDEDAAATAAQTLGFMISHGGQDFCEKIYKTAGSVSTLVAAMGSGNIHDLQYFASEVLLGLAIYTGRELCKELLRVGGAIQMLVDAIAESQNEVVPMQAAGSLLQVLAQYGGEDAREKIYKTPGSISNIVNAMGREQPYLRPIAVSTLVHLVEHSGMDSCKEISSVEGAIPSLVAAVAETQTEVSS